MTFNPDVRGSTTHAVSKEYWYADWSTKEALQRPLNELGLLDAHSSKYSYHLMTGHRQHTLPAAYIAGFSDARRERIRESVVWVGRRGRDYVYQKKAENLCYTRDIYTLTRPIFLTNSPWSPRDLDAMWSRVERRLTTVIAALVERRDTFFDAESWLTVLVEFVAQVFVRGEDFGRRFTNRLNAISPEVVSTFQADHSDHINGARLLELHRLRGAILQAEWTILHAEGGLFVTNDLARTPIVLGDGRVGYLLPMRKDAALLLTFSPQHRSMEIFPSRTEDRWLVGPIGHDTVRDSDLARFNQLLAYSARAEIYGDTEPLVRELLTGMDPDPVPLEEAEPTFLAPFRDLGDTRQHEQLFALVHTRPSQYGKPSDAGPEDSDGPT